MQCRIQVWKKEGARLHTIVKLTDFGVSFALKKVKFVEKREGRAPPRPPLNPTLLYVLVLKDSPGRDM